MLPSGARLSDPYAVMKDPRFHVQPGIFQSAGSNPATADSWIDLAKQGKVDADGFVRALTLIFQKRGYKWDAVELQKMTDDKLKDFWKRQESLATTSPVLFVMRSNVGVRI